ncbi:MAG: 16S rRNA (cytidine(1402)-2'-O)-methyltransferase [Bacteroidetes bacterium]|nr:16S rRNA (cytidine(1402)-2'-O)-methyltransferase [Bacteroidota bacterium]
MAKLIVVPTPIGNLADITLRALETLKTVDFILAEDTRTSSHLLKHYAIDKKISAYHMHNEHAMVESLTERIAEVASVALVTDAGTPGISDPGFLLIRECLKKGIAVECLPGPTAFVPALVNSGLPCERFCFEGFLPVKKGRQTRLQEIKEETRTMVFYESPYRVVKTLEQFCELFGNDREASISRELTKFYEENKKGTLFELVEHFKKKEPKGEFVIVVAGKKE